MQGNPSCQKQMNNLQRVNQVQWDVQNNRSAVRQRIDVVNNYNDTYDIINAIYTVYGCGDMPQKLSTVIWYASDTPFNSIKDDWFKQWRCLCTNKAGNPCACSQNNLVINHVMFNPHTGCRLNIGDDCIKRFSNLFNEETVKDIDAATRELDRIARKDKNEMLKCLKCKRHWGTGKTTCDDCKLCFWSFEYYKDYLTVEMEEIIGHNIQIRNKILAERDIELHQCENKKCGTIFERELGVTRITLCKSCHKKKKPSMYRNRWQRY